MCQVPQCGCVIKKPWNHIHQVRNCLFCTKFQHCTFQGQAHRALPPAEKKLYTDLTRAVGLTTDASARATQVAAKFEAQVSQGEGEEVTSSPPLFEDGPAPSSGAPIPSSGAPIPPSGAPIPPSGAPSVGRERRRDTRGLPLYPLTNTLLQEYVA